MYKESTWHVELHFQWIFYYNRYIYIIYSYIIILFNLYGNNYFIKMQKNMCVSYVYKRFFFLMSRKNIIIIINCYTVLFVKYLFI